MIKDRVNELLRLPFKVRRRRRIKEDIDRFITLAYQLTLERGPDPIGKAHYFEALSSERLSWDGFLRDLLASDEFLSKILQRYPEYGEIGSGQNEAGGDLIRNLTDVQHLGREKYERDWEELFGKEPRELVIGQEEYVRYHKERFYELLNAMAFLLREKLHSRVLEIGVSEFSAFYKRYFPGITLVTADRPIPAGQPGFDEKTCRRIAKSDEHYAADLNVDRLAPDYGRPALGNFDLILCTEVIEHLTVNPIELLRDVIGLLNVGGYLYLTTPNFFSHDKLLKIKRHENPQLLYPPRGENWDAHHHFREYGMKELVRFVAEARGEVVACCFSHCWDAPELVRDFLSRYPDQKSNLVVIARRS